MTKHNGKYYLQYAAPGTQFNVYGDGVYVGKSPLGPFEYAAHNPFCYKPGGFATGAGHGSTVCGPGGIYWHFGTIHLSINYKFERRLCMFPTFFRRRRCDVLRHLLWRLSSLFSRPGFATDDKRWFPGLDVAFLWQTREGFFAIRKLSGGKNVTDENLKTFWVAGKK